jgi:molecular chaperone GrpE
MAEKNKREEKQAKENNKAELEKEISGEEAVIEEVAPEITPLEKSQKECEEYKDLLMRLQADFENYKKRNKELSSKMYQAGITDVITKIFPVLDSLELALKAYQDQNRSGIEQVIKQFVTIFGLLGVKEITAEGEDFNPEFHDAVMKCEAPEGIESGKVVEVFRKGYVYQEKVLRPAMVKVAN